MISLLVAIRSCTISLVLFEQLSWKRGSVSAVYLANKGFCSFCTCRMRRINACWYVARCTMFSKMDHLPVITWRRICSSDKPSIRSNRDLCWYSSLVVIEDCNCILMIAPNLGALWTIGTYIYILSSFQYPRSEFSVFSILPNLFKRFFFKVS